MTHNAADRKSIRAAEKSAKLADTNRAAITAQIASTIEGRRYLWDKLAEANIFSSTFSDDPGRMAFLEGRRAGGLDLLNDIITACPDQFILMMRESNERRTVTDRSSAGERNGGEDANWRDQGSVDSIDGSGTTED